MEDEHKRSGIRCSEHPDAPHGFMRDASHSAGRYVCECEGWEPNQEPVAWITNGGKGELWWHQSSKFDEEGNLIGPNPDDIPLYTAPLKKEWVGLTDKEIQDLGYLSEKFDASNSEWFDRWGFAQAIEAKLKEKNT